MMFLLKIGFSRLSNVQMGNVYLDREDNIKVGGYELTLLGYRNRLGSTFVNADVPQIKWSILLFGEWLAVSLHPRPVI